MGKAPSIVVLGVAAVGVSLWLGIGGGARPQERAPEAPPNPEMVAAGKMLHLTRGCVTCHTTDGSPGMGPTLADVYGKTQRMADGREVVADAAYLRRSIIEPKAEIVPGYAAEMLSYKQVLSEKEIAALVAYYKSLRDVAVDRSAAEH